jgi:hypothetical protein
VRCHGLESSEIEDLYAIAIYSPFVLDRYNVELTAKNIGTTGVWTSRVRAQFIKQNGNWEADDSTEKEVKREIARLVQQHPETALSQYRRHSFDSLVGILERKLFPPPVS